MTQVMKFVFNTVEKIVEKEKNGGYLNFLLFLLRFQKVLFLGLIGLCVSPFNTIGRSSCFCGQHR